MAEPKLSQTVKELKSAVIQLQQGDFQVRQAFGSLNETLQAVVSLLGEESVTGEIERLRQERQEKQEGEMAAGIKVLVDNGVLVPTAEATAETLNVGTDSGVDGRIRRVQFETRAIPAEMQAQFIGKKPGESVTNNGVTLTLTEVYAIDKVKAAEYQAKQQAAAAQQPEQVVVNANGATAADVAEVKAEYDEATQKAIDESGDPAVAESTDDAPQA